MTLEQELQESEAALRRDLLVKSLGSRTHLTIKQIAELLDSEQYASPIATITLQDLLDEAKGKKPKKKTATAAKKPRKSAAAPPEENAPAEKNEMEEAISSALGDLGEPIGIADIVKLMDGATAAQIRPTLQSMIEAGTLTVAGTGRWTKYLLV